MKLHLAPTQIREMMCTQLPEWPQATKQIASWCENVVEIWVKAECKCDQRSESRGVSGRIASSVQSNAYLGLGNDERVTIVNLQISPRFSSGRHHVVRSLTLQRTYFATSSKSKMSRIQVIGGRILMESKRGVVMLVLILFLEEPTRASMKR